VIQTKSDPEEPDSLMFCWRLQAWIDSNEAVDQPSTTTPGGATTHTTGLLTGEGGGNA
jgi:hypothetical protein